MTITIRPPFVDTVFQTPKTQLTILSYASPKLYAASLVAMQNTCDDADATHIFQIFDETDTLISSSKILFIPDLLSFDFNTTKITTPLKKYLQKAIANSEEEWYQLEKTATLLAEQSSQFLTNINIPLSVNTIWDVPTWIKALGIKIDWNPTGDLLVKAQQIISINGELNLANLIVFTNLNQVYSKEEIEALAHYAVAENQAILCLQMSERKGNYSALISNIFVDETLDVFLPNEMASEPSGIANSDFVEVLE